MNIFLVLPNQLFEETINHINERNGFYNKIVIYEEPHYFSDEIKPNKIKIAYLRACMRYYYDTLKKNFSLNKINYYECNNSSPLNKTDNYYCYEINDYKLMNKYKSFSIKINEIETPMFILNKVDLDIYNKKKGVSHASLYELSKKKLGILQGVKNQDVYNRSNPKINIPFNDNTNTTNTNNTSLNSYSYYEEGIKYSMKPQFKLHVGNPTIEALRFYPITSKDSYESYETFLKSKIENFGLYQDVIQDSNPFMYHSLISPMLNNGLIVPMELIRIIKKYEKKIDIKNYEGFLRQIIGWREYMRYLYLYRYDEIIKSNSFNNNKSLTKDWYSGTTGNLVIDTEIKKAITYGYSHHIVRLMVFLSFMIMNEIRPEDIYKWFMEVVSIDAYDWVMVSNIYCMGYFSKIGMRRPYLSSSNYLLKMSNYKKDGEWNLSWDNSFRTFVKSKKINFYLRSIK